MPGSKNPFLEYSKARRSRRNFGGLDGLEMSGVGTTLAGCIIAGGVLGWFLDQHLGTTFLTPVLFLAGVYAGFREVFRTVKRVTDRQAAAKLASQREQSAPEASGSGKSGVVRERSADVATQDEPASGSRLFRVPAPPVPSFDAGPKVSRTPVTKPENKDKQGLFERLLNENPDEEKPSEPR